MVIYVISKMVIYVISKMVIYVISKMVVYVIESRESCAECRHIDAALSGFL